MQLRKDNSEGRMTLGLVELALPVGFSPSLSLSLSLSLFRSFALALPLSLDSLPPPLSSLCCSLPLKLSVVRSPGSFSEPTHPQPDSLSFPSKRAEFQAQLKTQIFLLSRVQIVATPAGRRRRAHKKIEKLRQQSTKTQQQLVVETKR
jgi:hypothetical protein